jgi:thymidine kinase
MVWCQVNNLSLNVSKTKELIVNFRRNQAGQAPILINRAAIETVNNFKFLGLHISE